MARISVLLIAASTAILGVQAGTCPHNGINSFYCGSQLRNVFKCTTAEALRALNPTANVETSIYFVNDNGDPSLFALDCQANGGCRDAGPNGIPQSRCNI